MSDIRWETWVQSWPAADAANRQPLYVTVMSLTSGSRGVHPRGKWRKLHHWISIFRVGGRKNHLKITFTWNSKVITYSKNLVYKGVDIYVQNALKLTYEHLWFTKFSLGLYPVLPFPLKAREGTVEEGRGREERGRVASWLLGRWTPLFGSAIQRIVQFFWQQRLRSQF